MATDLKDYTRMIDSLVDGALDSVADTILTKMGIKEEDDPNFAKYNDVYEDIEKYLIQKWQKEINDRFIKKKVSQIEGQVQRYLEPDCNKIYGDMSFYMTEEADKAAEVLQQMGYETERYYADGYEVVDYWKPGHKPELDRGV